MKFFAWLSLLSFIFLFLAGLVIIGLYFDNFFLRFILSGLLFFLLLIIFGWINSKIISK